MKRFAFFLALLGGSLFAGPFTNGNMESPVLGFGQSSFSTPPTGWSKFDPSCGSLNCSGTGLFLEDYAAFGTGLPSAGGDPNQAFGFGGNGITTGSLMQVFDTLAGTSYH